MLLRRRGDTGKIKGTWHSGEVEKRALPRPQSEDRTEDTREGKVPEWQGQATMTISDSVTGSIPTKLGPGWMPEGDPRCHPRVGPG